MCPGTPEAPALSASWHLWCGFGRGCRPYNFVHFPWSKLAVVSFIDAEKLVDSAGCVSGVRSAAQHGLLAHFYSSGQGRASEFRLMSTNLVKISLRACQLDQHRLTVAPGQRIQIDSDKCHSSSHLHSSKIEARHAWPCLGMKGTRILIDL